MRIIGAVLIGLLAASAAFAQEHGRIKRRPPTQAEADRIASDMAMNDGLLRKGDIVVTDRGFMVFQGTAADGLSNEFSAIPNPLQDRKPRLPRHSE